MNDIFAQKMALRSNALGGIMQALAQMKQKQDAEEQAKLAEQQVRSALFTQSPDQTFQFPTNRNVPSAMPQMPQQNIPAQGEQRFNPYEQRGFVNRTDNPTIAPMQPAGFAGTPKQNVTVQGQPQFNPTMESLLPLLANAKTAPYVTSVLGGMKTVQDLQPKREPYTLSEGQTRYSADGTPIATGTPKQTVDKAIHTYTGADNKEHTVFQRVNPLPGQNAIYERISESNVAPKGSAVTGNAQGFDAKVIAEQIKSGQLPPTSAGYSRGQWGVIASELGKDKDYNLSTAQTDWNATQKHFATLNNPQQTRLRQAAQTAYDSFDVIEGLANEWKSGRFPLLNKANLIAAKNGLLGQEAQSIATRLEAQINDVTSEMSQVYMAGNTPTDHALKLASANLSADWSLKTLKDALDLGRKNMKIRLNSINNIQTISASGNNNPYIQQGAVQTDQQTQQPDNSGFEVGKTYIDANGNKAKYLGNGNWE